MKRFHRTLTAATLSTLTVAASFASTALANDDVFTVADYQSRPGEISLGDWQDHKASHVVRFYLPQYLNTETNGVLQMGLRSTNKSRYNEIYVNPEYLPYDGDPCGSIHDNPNNEWRLDYLPYSEHDSSDRGHENIWRTYHRVVPGQLLKPGEENVILVCARNRDGETHHGLDNFYIRDIVLNYRISPL